MDAHKATIGGIFQNGRVLEIPFYQRAYVWDEVQWSRFLDDTAFITKTHKPFFFGSIILKDAPIGHGESDYVSEKKVITDGQQRLTTLTIFMKVLSLLTGQTDGFSGLFCLDDGEPAVRHGKYDAEAFAKVIQKTDATTFPEDEAKSQIIKAFNYFITHITPANYSWKLIKQHALFVSIELLEDEDEQQIFDTINSPGVSLSTSELLKNHFFSKNEIADYNEKWVKVFEVDDSTRSYWNQGIDVGRRKQSLIDIFFNAYFQILIQGGTWKVTTEDKIAYERVDRLAASYKDFIKNYCKGDKQIVLEGMAEYAKCFAKAFEPDLANQCIASGSANYELERINVIIFGLNNTTMIPYVLYVERSVDSAEEKAKIYKVLEAYIMRRTVVHASTKNYNSMFNSLILNKVLTAEDLKAAITNVQDSTDITTYFPSDKDLLIGFQTSKLVNLHSKAILYFIESAIHPASSATSLKGFNGYSLEHLMPKKWRNNWGTLATREEANERDSILLTLGNLAIITQSLNASIRDSSWFNKLNGKSGKPGLKLCASGLVTMQTVLESDAWCETLIKERAQTLHEYALKIWSID